MVGATRSVSDASLNPPVVAITEDVSAGDHCIMQYGNNDAYGPVVNFKFYLRAGTRQYLSVCALLQSSGAVINVNTVSWAISNYYLSGCTLNAITLSDLGNGDRLLDVTLTYTAPDINLCIIGGAPDATAAYRPAYTGNGSTLLIRRVDLATLLGAGTVTVAATTGTTLTGTTQHTPAGNAAVIRYICRNTVTTAHNPLTATFQGQPVVFPAGSQASNISAISKAFVGIGYVTGLTPGTPGSLAVTSNRTMGQLVARVDDAPGLTAAKIGAAASTSSVTSSASPAISGTMTAAGSIVLAVAGAINGGADPFSLSGGWTEQAEGQSGTAATDAAAVFGMKAGGAAATVETMTATGAIATTAWGGAILELKT
jgi:hypothetical protein